MDTEALGRAQRLTVWHAIASRVRIRRAIEAANAPMPPLWVPLVSSLRSLLTTCKLLKTRADGQVATTGVGPAPKPQARLLGR